MRQVTLRVSDDLWKDLQLHAKLRGVSANKLATDMLEATLRPDQREEHRAWMLSRLRAAGLLAEGHVATPEDGPPLTEQELQAAREDASRSGGRSLLTYILEDRGRWKPGDPEWM